jgi:hypothetical protein
MSEQPNRRQRPRRNADDPERALVVALRWAVVPTICLPLAVAAVGASATGGGISPTLARQLAGLALIANVGCWVKVTVLWRALPRPDDDDQGWRRWWWDTDSPLDPSIGPGGITVDWARFERDFWSHVKQRERQRGHELIHALALPLRVDPCATDWLPIAQRTATTSPVPGPPVARSSRGQGPAARAQEEPNRTDHALSPPRCHKCRPRPPDHD